MMTHEPSIAMFMDFENLARGLDDEKPPQKFEIRPVIARLLEKGKIIVKKAYSDWQYFLEYKRQLHESAIELIDIPHKRISGKNSADIRMVVDAMDLCYSKEHLEIFVIVSGDSDFSPLVSKLKENGKHVIGLGLIHSSSDLLIQNCDEFIFYEDIIRDSLRPPPLDKELPKVKREAFGLLLQSIAALMRENKEILWGSMIKQTMQRKRPSFNEGYFGYDTFSQLLIDAERHHLLSLKRDIKSGTFIVTGFCEAPH